MSAPAMSAGEGIVHILDTLRLALRLLDVTNRGLEPEATPCCPATTV